MARIKDRQKAVRLRLSGKSYSEIKDIIGVSKGTLSYWLKDHPLSKEQMRSLRDLNPLRIEHYRETRKRNKEKLLSQVYKEEKKNIFPLSKRDLFIAGLFLYWGEGSKTRESEPSLSNTNPAVIKFFILWLEKCLSVSKADIKIKLHLYKDMDAKKEVDFWSKSLGVKKSQFIKPYVKTSVSHITYRNGFGHGTCNATIGNAHLGRKILMGLKTIEDYFNFIR